MCPTLIFLHHLYFIILIVHSELNFGDNIAKRENTRKCISCKKAVILREHFYNGTCPTYSWMSKISVHCTCFKNCWIRAVYLKLIPVWIETELCKLFQFECQYPSIGSILVWSFWIQYYLRKIMFFCRFSLKSCFPSTFNFYFGHLWPKMYKYQYCLSISIIFKVWILALYRVVSQTVYSPV